MSSYFNWILYTSNAISWYSKELKVFLFHSMPKHTISLISIRCKPDLCAFCVTGIKPMGPAFGWICRFQMFTLLHVGFIFYFNMDMNNFGAIVHCHIALSTRVFVRYIRICVTSFVLFKEYLYNIQNIYKAVRICVHLCGSPRSAIYNMCNFTSCTQTQLLSFYIFLLSVWISSHVWVYWMRVKQFSDWHLTGHFVWHIFAPASLIWGHCQCSLMSKLLFFPDGSNTHPIANNVTINDRRVLSV